MGSLETTSTRAPRSDAACAAALSQVQWPARLQRLDPALLPALPPESEVWLDGGHNVAAGEALAVDAGATVPACVEINQ